MAPYFGRVWARLSRRRQYREADHRACTVLVGSHQLIAA
jgi:hypothetical protein